MRLHNIYKKKNNRDLMHEKRLDLKSLKIHQLRWKFNTGALKISK